MIQVCIDAADCRSRQELHRVFAQTLSFPAWYGNNLDAMHDCLTDCRRDVTLTLRHTDALKENLGPYADCLLRMLRDVTVENSHFRLVTSENGGEETL